MNEEIARVITGAIAAAGPIGNRSSYDWEQQVIACLPVVATMFDEERPVAERAMLFADAHVYTGLFIDVKIEESSQRAILRTDPEKTKDGVAVIDEIRTDRVDSTIGARIYKLLQSCRPGDSMLVWRVNEPMRTDKMKNVRVAYHVKRLRRAAGSQPSVPPAGAAERSAPRPPTPSGVAGGPDITVLERFRQLSSEGRVAVIAACKDKGVIITGNLSGDDEFVVLQHIIAYLQSTDASW